MTNFDYLYNPNAAKRFFGKNHFVDEKLGFQVIENGMILPCRYFPNEPKVGGGVVNGEGLIIDGTFVHRRAHIAYTPLKESIQYSSETVVYLGVLHDVWGHQITDSIKYLWFLNSEPFKSEFKNCPLVYLSLNKADYISSNGRGKNVRRLLQILDINPDELRLITKPTQFKKIIVPDESFFHDIDCIKFTPEYRETIDRIRDFALKNSTPISNKKLYFIHSYGNGLDQVGEERLAEYFKSKGYEIIRPENLTFNEQLNWLINCESFASTIGSSSHNSIFLNEHTEVILIPRSNNLFPGYQELMDQVRSLNVSYIDSTLSILHNDNGFFLYIVSPQLKHFFGDNFDGYQEDDFKIFLQYVKEGLNRGFSVNPSAKKYYDPILSEFLTQLKQHKDLIVAHNMPPSFETFLSPLDHQSDIDKEGWLLSKFMTGVKQRNDLASTPNTSPHFEKSLPPLSYQTHVNREGWSSWIEDNQISNDISQNLNLQAIKIDYSDHKIYYSVYHNEEEGWSEEVTAGQMAGTTGKSKPIYGMKVRLDEAGSKEFDIFYSMHKFDGTWTPWAKNGENLYSYGQKLNAIQIKLESKKDMI